MSFRTARRCLRPLPPCTTSHALPMRRPNRSATRLMVDTHRSILTIALRTERGLHPLGPCGCDRLANGRRARELAVRRNRIARSGLNQMVELEQRFNDRTCGVASVELAYRHGGHVALRRRILGTPSDRPQSWAEDVL